MESSEPYIYKRKQEKSIRNTRIVQVVPTSRWFRALIKLIVGKVYHAAYKVSTMVISLSSIFKLMRGRKELVPSLRENSFKCN